MGDTDWEGTKGRVDTALGQTEGGHTEGGEDTDESGYYGVDTDKVDIMG